MDRGALLPAPRQRRGRAPGPEAGAVGRGERAHGGAGGGAAPAAAGGGGEGDAALRDAAGAPAADRFRRVEGDGRGRDGSRAPVRGDARLLAADLRAGVRPSAPVGVVRGHRGCVPALRRRHGRGAGGQREGAGGAPRRGDARGGVQRAVPRVRGAPGVPAAGVRAVPGADQGQGRERGAPREAQRHRGPPVRELGRPKRPPGVVDAGDRGHALSRHHGRGAAGALRARGGAAEAVRREAAVRTAA